VPAAGCATPRNRVVEGSRSRRSVGPSWCRRRTAEGPDEHDHDPLGEATHGRAAKAPRHRPARPARRPRRPRGHALGPRRNGLDLPLPGRTRGELPRLWRRWVEVEGVAAPARARKPAGRLAVERIRPVEGPIEEPCHAAPAGSPPGEARPEQARRRSLLSVLASLPPIEEEEFPPVEELPLEPVDLGTCATSSTPTSSPTWSVAPRVVCGNTSCGSAKTACARASSWPPNCASAP
jgi:hypothetical protein